MSQLVGPAVGGLPVKGCSFGRWRG